MELRGRDVLVQPILATLLVDLLGLCNAQWSGGIYRVIPLQKNLDDLPDKKLLASTM